MNRMMKMYLTLTCVVIVWGISARDAEALPQFQKQFLTMYVEGNDNQEFVTLVTKKAKCLVCHRAAKDEKGKTSKKNRNAYGNELAKLLNKGDKKELKKIQEALEKAGQVKTNPRDPDSPTYGDLISQGKLPVELSREE